jgi:DSBA-like thioredoxin domain
MQPKELPPPYEPPRALPRPEPPKDWRPRFAIGALLAALLATWMDSTAFFLLAFSMCAAVLLSWLRAHSRGWTLLAGAPLLWWGLLESAGHDDSIIAYAQAYPLLALVLLFMAGVIAGSVALDREGWERFADLARIGKPFRKWRDRVEAYGHSKALGILFSALGIFLVLALLEPFTPERGWNDFRAEVERLVGSRAAALNGKVSQDVIAQVARARPDQREDVQAAALEAAKAAIEQLQAALTRLANIGGSPAVLSVGRAKIKELSDSAPDQLMAELQEPAGRARAQAQAHILTEARERIAGAAWSAMQKVKPTLLSDAEPELLAAHRLARDKAMRPAALDSVVGRLVSELEKQATAARREPSRFGRSDRACRWRPPFLRRDPRRTDGGRATQGGRPCQKLRGGSGSLSQAVPSAESAQGSPYTARASMCRSMSASRARWKRAALAIEVISDAICPWCWVAKRRLGRAIAALAPAMTASVTWRPFELNPEMPKAGVDRRAYRSAKFGSWQRSQALDAQVAAAGRSEGLLFNHDTMERTPNTLDAHRLIRLAGQQGKQDAPQAVGTR